MAGTLPLQSCLPLPLKLLSPPPTSLLLFLLLLSLLLALSLLHLHDLVLSHSAIAPSFLQLSPLLPDRRALLSHLLHVQQHYVAFLLSPCSIFVFANLIVFTLLLKSVYFSSAPAAGSFKLVLEDCADNVDETLQLAQHLLPHHDDFCLSLAQYGIPAEEHHILSFTAGYGENTSMQARYSMDEALTQPRSDEVRRPDAAKTAGKKVRSAETVMPLPAMPTLLHEEHEAVVEARGLQRSRSEEKTINRPSSIIVNMEVAPVKRSRCIPATTMAQASASRPSLALPPPEKASSPPTNTSTLSHRPPSTPRVKKITQSSGRDGRHEASRSIQQLDADNKEPANVSKPVEQKKSMVRSHSDQRLSQRSSSSRAEDGNTVITSPSSLITNQPRLHRAQSVRSTGSASTIADTSSSSRANKPHIQRAQSLRSSSAADNIVTDDATTGSPSSPAPASKPHIQRAQSLREHRISHGPQHGQVRRSPSLSESLDGLSDAEANKCFSDFIAHRFAMMKKEQD